MRIHHYALSIIHSRCLLSFLLVFLLVGCGPVNTTSSTPSSTATTSSLNGKLIVVRDQLKVYYHRGIDCPPDTLSITPNALVLASEQSSYDNAEIKQMAEFVDSLYDRLHVYNDIYTIYDQVPTNLTAPKTLQFVPGSPMKGTISWPYLSGDTGCRGTIEITNTSKTAFQLVGIFVQLTAAPHQNTQHYNLVDICSLPIHHTGLECPAGLQGGGGEYEYQFRLSQAPAQTVFRGQSQQDPQNTGVTINPGEALTTHLNFTSSGTAEKPGNLVYDVLPQLVIDISGEQQTISLLQLKTRLMFVNASQLSCYRLQGNSFVLLKPGSARSRFWCL